MNWKQPSCSIHITGDKEYFIDFYGIRVKYNDKWYTVDVRSGYSRGLEELYTGLNYKEEVLKKKWSY
jgi:hypothetical protein